MFKYLTVSLVYKETSDHRWDETTYIKIRKVFTVIKKGKKYLILRGYKKGYQIEIEYDDIEQFTIE